MLVLSDYVRVASSFVHGGGAPTCAKEVILKRSTCAIPFIFVLYKLNINQLGQRMAVRRESHFQPIQRTE